MTLLERIRSFLRGDDLTERAITPAQLFSTGLDDIYDTQSATGIFVTAELAMQSAIGACVRLLADDISSLPIDAFRKVGESSVPITMPDWLERPSGRRWDTSDAFISDFVVSLGLDGNAFIACTPNVMAPERVEVLDPDTVEIHEQNGRVLYRINGRADFGEDRIVHVPWVRIPGKIRGIDVVTASRETSGLELAAREYASRFFGNGAIVGGVIQHPGKPTPEEITELRKSFAKRHQGRSKSHAFGILTGGAEYNPMTLRPQEAELQPLWQHVLEEAARIFHIPPHLLASQDPGGSSFSSVEQRSIEYGIHAVTPVTTRIERTLSRLLPGEDTFIKLNINGLLRGDAKTRAEYYRIMTEMKAMQPSWVARLEDLPPEQAIEGWLETPNNNGPRGRGDTARDGVTVHDARTTLKLDSVQVSDEAARQMLGANEDGWTRILSRLDERDVSLAEVLSELFGQSEARAARIEERLDAAEEREHARTLPITRETIEVDEAGRPTHIVQRQGDRTWHKIIERDGPRIISVKEVAA